MSRVCTICGKRPVSGNKISHANNKSRTRWIPNLKRVRSIIDGTVKRVMVCTRCIRSHLVTKPA